MKRHEGGDAAMAFPPFFHDFTKIIILFFWQH